MAARGSSCDSSLYPVDTVFERLNSPEVACDSVGLRSSGSAFDDGKIPPVPLPGQLTSRENQIRELTVFQRIRRWPLRVENDVRYRGGRWHEPIPVRRLSSKVHHDFRNLRSQFQITIPATLNETPQQIRKPNG